MRVFVGVLLTTLVVGAVTAVGEKDLPVNPYAWAEQGTNEKAVRPAPQFVPVGGLPEGLTASTFYVPKTIPDPTPSATPTPSAFVFKPIARPPTRHPKISPSVTPSLKPSPVVHPDVPRAHPNDLTGLGTPMDVFKKQPLEFEAPEIVFVPPDPSLEKPPPSEGDCGQYQSCIACTGQATCGWCPLEGHCVPGNAVGPVDPDTCTTYAYEEALCPHNPCQVHRTCCQCLNSPNCGWCASAGACMAGERKGPTGSGCSDWRFDSCAAPPPPETPAKECQRLRNPDEACFPRKCKCHRGQHLVPYNKPVQRDAVLPPVEQGADMDECDFLCEQVWKENRRRDGCVEEEDVPL